MPERKKPEQPSTEKIEKDSPLSGQSERDKQIEAGLWNVPDSVRAEHLARAARQAQERDAQGKEHAENAQKLAALQQRFGIKDPNQMREEVIQKALADGGVRMHTAAVDKQIQSKSGFMSLESRIKDGRTAAEISIAIGNTLHMPGVQRNPDRWGQVLNAHRVNEIVDIRHDTKQVWENVVSPGRKVLGVSVTPDRTERKPTNRFEPRRHRDVVEGGRDEPAVRITYCAGGSDYTERQDSDNMTWKAYDGRGGQVLIFELVVPELVAKDIEREVDKDPSFIRELVERFAMEKILKDPRVDDPDAWKTGRRSGDSLRPPYERWDAETGGRIYIQKEGQAPGWHDENVKKIRQK